MNDRKTRSRSAGGGMGLPVLLTIIFIILRATGTVDWKWYWVFSPIWISLGIGIIFFIFVGCCLIGALIGIFGAAGAGMADGIKGWFGKKEEQEDIKDVSYEEEPDDQG
ncbi:MAG: hypothetical protein FK733_00230 [Asgard group archaeon]|nr:hypothetical protein [Asgard group archaeon]